MYEIIDAHIHPGEDRYYTNWYGMVQSCRKQILTLQAAGVNRACGSVIAPVLEYDFKLIRELNDCAMQIRDCYPDFYMPGIIIHPAFPEESCAELERCHNNGVRWVGELVGYMMNYNDEYASERFLPIMHLAAELSMPVNIHCSSTVEIRKLCSSVPNLNVVLAHIGSSENTAKERIHLVAELANLYLDTSGGGTERYGVIRYLINHAGADKIIFGSDFPINNPSGTRQHIIFETVSEHEEQQIFSGNFLRLLNGER